uniref:(northern house mosquito) hypothetical protein n=1 Tax=Culex pipiens TaxID=7175 RepID=A0A8D8FQI1_CULPI
MWPVLPGTAVLKFSGGKLTGGTDHLLLLCDNCCCFVIVDRRAPGHEHRSVVTAVEATIFVVPVALVLLVPHFISRRSFFFSRMQHFLLFCCSAGQGDFVLDFVRVEPYVMA